ncbi:MAG TPA: hypothetical protein VGQ42_12060 [Candidatus Dormibacteraeota bacterium]|nr:hypothetical protein [Candidatus Dormibacteraeota bacterium]
MTDSDVRRRLTPREEQVWVAELLHPDVPTHNLGIAVTMAGRLDRGALRLALREVAAHHEMLRSSLTEQDGEAWFTVHPHAGDMLAETAAASACLNAANQAAAQPIFGALPDFVASLILPAIVAVIVEVVRRSQDRAT